VQAEGVGQSAGALQVLVQTVVWPKFLQRQDMQLLSIVQVCKKAVVPGVVQVPVPESGAGAGSLPQDGSMNAARNKITSVKREATAR
jgi:hypothetical protein